MYRFLISFSVLYFLFSANSLLAQSRFEIDVTLGYSNPLLETRGDDVVLSAAKDFVLISGKRWLVSDNLGAEIGYMIQSNLKYSIIKKGYLKGILNIGYNRLYSLHDGPDDSYYGVKIQSFSLGIGAEVLPFASKKFTPSLFGLLRYNLIGGETFHLTGLDFFKVTSRFGYSAGINFYYSLNRKLNLFIGGSYSYDNLWNKKTDETTPVDAHVIVFRDRKSETNGLTSDRRIVYSSFYFGISFKL